ncbi:hypothetical protein KC19_7G080800 [Ceratodon purpureus]|uniref:F-box domain-containing protein n=1 Tax=Ceratodon purpureus TaxID=3225 RepID=A0A8T0H443_CERPU|nr:hypothetical protein KC19_7G080800 [Ceratodon purpureus]
MAHVICLSDSSSADDSEPSRQTIRACRSSACSSASLGCVADLVFWYLPVRTLVRCKVLSKEWRAWCEKNLVQIAKERRKDESKLDWYFPLAFEHRKHARQRFGLSRLWTWKWYGMHQGTKEQHPLVGFDFLPGFSLSRSDYALQAVSSGLVVFVRIAPRGVDFDLIVCNPLSKKWKILPRHADCVIRRVLYRERIENARTELVLKDLPNEYMVIRLSVDSIDVYTSSNEQWVCAPFGHHRYVGFYNVSSVYLKGHVYMLQMTEEVPYLGTLRWSYMLRIYDIESGRYELKTFISSILVSEDYSVENVPVHSRACDPTLVVCMNNLYAVGVSCRAGRNHVKRHRRHETYVANCEFHIFSLMEEGRLLDGGLWKHVVTVPVVFRGVKQDVVKFWEACRMFSSVARSNVIYLAWSSRRLRSDCLPVNYLEYDVVSGLHTTYVVGAHHRQEFPEPFSDRGCDMAYSPCLDLEP